MAVLLPSFTPEEIAMCECSSIIPEVKCNPVPFIILASAGIDIFSPIAAIFPLSTKTETFFKIPYSSFVQAVTLEKTIFSSLGNSPKP